MNYKLSDLLMKEHLREAVKSWGLERTEDKIKELIVNPKWQQQTLNCLYDMYPGFGRKLK